jgi:hypothetical protein
MNNPIISNEELLELAREFDLGSGYKIKYRGSVNGKKKWCVIIYEQVLNKEGRFEPEPSPSNRTTEFIENTRFESPQEAYQAFMNIKIEEQ